jgi:hypothetical protein
LCPADWLAFVDLSTDSPWLFTIDQARELAQQHSPNNQRQLYWYIDEPAPKSARLQKEMEKYRIDAVAIGLSAGNHLMRSRPNPGRPITKSRQRMKRKSGLKQRWIGQNDSRRHVTPIRVTTTGF